MAAQHAAQISEQTAQQDLAVGLYTHRIDSSLAGIKSLFRGSLKTGIQSPAGVIRPSPFLLWEPTKTKLPPISTPPLVCTANALTQVRNCVPDTSKSML